MFNLASKSGEVNFSVEKVFYKIKDDVFSRSLISLVTLETDKAGDLI